MKHESFIIMWDFPQETKNLSQFYRRLHELLADQGGNAQCRATKSSYIVSGENARTLAYAIGALASSHGAGHVGEQDGVVVLPLSELTPSEHFDALKQADVIVARLNEDRRKRANKKQPRDIAVIAAQSREKKEDAGCLIDVRELTRTRARVEA